MKIAAVLFAFLTFASFTNVTSAQTDDTNNLSVAGAAIHVELNRNYYLGVLYTNDSNASITELLNIDIPHKLEMLVTHKHISPRRFASIWNTRIAINNMRYTDELTALTDDVIGFASVLKDRVYNGDKISIANSPSRDALIVSVNGIEIDTFKRDLYPMLLRAWIGSTPPSTEFKQGMLSKGDITPSLVDQIHGWQVTAEQIARIESWAGPSAEELAAIEAEEIAKQKALEAEEKAKADEAAKAKAEAAKIAAAKRAQELKKKAAKAKIAARPKGDDIFEDDEDADLQDAAEQFASQLYRSQLLKWAYKYVRYPKRALEKEQEGQVIYQVTIDRSGNVVGLNLAQSSSYSLLDRSAEKSIDRAEPFPVIPSKIQGKQFTFDMPINFKLPKN